LSHPWRISNTFSVCFILCAWYLYLGLDWAFAIAFLSDLWLVFWLRIKPCFSFAFQINPMLLQGKLCIIQLEQQLFTFDNVYQLLILKETHQMSDCCLRLECSRLSSDDAIQRFASQPSRNTRPIASAKNINVFHWKNVLTYIHGHSLTSSFQCFALQERCKQGDFAHSKFAQSRLTFFGELSTMPWWWRHCRVAKCIFDRQNGGVALEFVANSFWLWWAHFSGLLWKSVLFWSLLTFSSYCHSFKLTKHLIIVPFYLFSDFWFRHPLVFTKKMTCLDFPFIFFRFLLVPCFLPGSNKQTKSKKNENLFSKGKIWDSGMVAKFAFSTLEIYLLFWKLQWYSCSLCFFKPNHASLVQVFSKFDQNLPFSRQVGFSPSEPFLVAWWPSLMTADYTIVFVLPRRVEWCLVGLWRVSSLKPPLNAGYVITPCGRRPTARPKLTPPLCSSHHALSADIWFDPISLPRSLTSLGLQRFGGRGLNIL
jgi:hypothetical protein